jgi:hypothetical protein
MSKKTSIFLLLLLIKKYKKVKNIIISTGEMVNLDKVDYIRRPYFGIRENELFIDIIINGFLMTIKYDVAFGVDPEKIKANVLADYNRMISYLVGSEQKIDHLISEEEMYNQLTSEL